MRDPVHPLKSCPPLPSFKKRLKQNKTMENKTSAWMVSSILPAITARLPIRSSLRQLVTGRKPAPFTLAAPGTGSPRGERRLPVFPHFLAWLHPYRPCLGRVRTGRRTAPAGLPRVCAFQLAVLPSPCRTLYTIRTKLTLRTDLQNTCATGHSRGVPRV